MRLSLLRLKYPALRNRRALLRYAEQATSKFHATASMPSATVPLSNEVLRRPSLAPWARLIQKMVEADADLPRRLQVPARAIWRDLQINHGYTGCYNVVQEYVRSLRRPEAAVASSDRRKQKRAAPIPAPVSSGTVNPPQPAVRIAPPPRFMLMEPVRGNLDFETAEEWMKALQHGALSSEILSVEIPSLPIEQIDKLRNTGLCAPLPMRKRAMAMLSYLRGVRRASSSVAFSEYLSAPSGDIGGFSGAKVLMLYSSGKSDPTNRSRTRRRAKPFLPSCTLLRVRME